MRFWDLSTGTPGLTERATGFGFGRLEPDEVVERFGASPYLFYLYNVVSSFLSVVLSEPRAGTWDLTARVVRGQIAPGMVVPVFSSLLATGGNGMVYRRSVANLGGATLRARRSAGAHRARGRSRERGDLLCLHEGRDHEHRRCVLRAAAFAAATYALERMAEMRMSAVRSSVVLLFSSSAVSRGAFVPPDCTTRWPR